MKLIVIFNSGHVETIKCDYHEFLKDWKNRKQDEYNRADGKGRMMLDQRQVASFYEEE